MKRKKSERRGPWDKTEDRGKRFRLGVFLCLILSVFVGALIWMLFIFFPDRSSSGDDFYLELMRLVGVIVLISSGLIYVRRVNFGEVIRNISIWTGVAAVLLLGYTYQSELYQIVYRISGELIPGQATNRGLNELVITASMDGHFYINGKANGERVRFMIDTGASDITLSPQAASRIGIDLKSLQFTQRYQTANGIGFGAHYWLQNLSIGPFRFSEVKVSINQSEMSESLLGISFLEHFQSFEFRGDKLYLRK